MDRITQRIDGHGFTVKDVPTYVDDALKAHPSYVFKGKAAAVKRADYEAQIATAMEYPGVEGVVAAQIEGFGPLWFVIYIYDDETAARHRAYVAKQAQARAMTVANAAERS